MDPLGSPSTDQAIPSEADLWPTALTDVDRDLIAVRGYPIQELMGRTSFAEVIWLIFMGDLPDARTARLLDAVFVASIDHGPAAPSANASRLVASTGAEPGHAAAAGLMAIDRYHGGSLAPAMGILEDVVARHRAGAPLATAARDVVDEWRGRGERVLGFGHRVHPVDPRVERLFAIADELGFHSLYVDGAREVERALNDKAGRPIPMNLDGAIAAIFCGLGLPASMGNSMFMIARFVGLNAQAHEEQTRMRPMRRIHPDRSRYDGPALRHLADGAT